MSSTPLRPFQGLLLPAAALIVLLSKTHPCCSLSHAAPGTLHAEGLDHLDRLGCDHCRRPLVHRHVVIRLQLDPLAPCAQVSCKGGQPHPLRPIMASSPHTNTLSLVRCSLHSAGGTRPAPAHAPLVGQRGIGQPVGTPVSKHRSAPGPARLRGASSRVSAGEQTPCGANPEVASGANCDQKCAP